MGKDILIKTFAHRLSVKKLQKKTLQHCQMTTRTPEMQEEMRQVLVNICNNPEKHYMHNENITYAIKSI